LVKAFFEIKRLLEHITPGVLARRRDPRLTWGQLLASFCIYIDPLTLSLLEIRQQILMAGSVEWRWFVKSMFAIGSALTTHSKFHPELG
jgi:hypothetical protein